MSQENEVIVDKAFVPGCFNLTTSLYQDVILYNDIVPGRYTLQRDVEVGSSWPCPPPPAWSVCGLGLTVGSFGFSSAECVVMSV